MSEQDDQERNEPASEKRLREAREKGDLPRSRDLSAAIVVLAAVSTLIASRDQIALHASNIMHVGLRYSRDDLFSADGASRALSTAGLEALKLLGPVFTATLVAAVAAPALLGGLNFSGEALVPKFNRLDPIKGFGRLFSMNGLVELVKSLLKVILIGGVLAMYLRSTTHELYAVGAGSVNNGIAHAFSMLGHASLLFGSMLGVIAMVDAPWQKFSFAKKMRMTKQEQKDEHKESDGNPELKSRIRGLQLQVSRRRMMQDVPTADVIVVNPTHFAVALRYDDGAMRAPRVVAKGVDVIAQQIRDVAGANKVPLVEAAPLARALYNTTQVGKEIPAALYIAVAQILAYVYRLQQAVATGDLPPDPPTPEIDPDLLGPYRMDT
ncbi:flagellar biosynthetic protein FlhB [Luteibacter rhizovicinus]|uniref:Flagellar biosynthetic protein FlhB n=1 Tax=Luteibacter rhizovicinus TaxID=242606 RepID=A0A4R3YMX0_9GAMM|nr:flagellar biosynthesis protein FlhB [Luteibacter rhizovicinus]TCV94165.1 flagellar biosynthetic protein FlhB [Luteibacter rhizovicinus]